jgi:TRAP-type C4-dicarboxylate transport system permease small subunit
VSSATRKESGAAAALWSWIARAMDVAGAALLLSLAVMTLIDVAGRELHGINRIEFFARIFGTEPLFSPLKGADELTVILMATSTYAVFAGVTWRQEHVAVDLVDMFYPKPWIAPREIVINLLAAAFLAVIAWALWQRAARTAESGEVFQYLRIARAPFLYFFTGVTALTALVLVANAGRYLVGRGPLQRSAASQPHDG